MLNVAILNGGRGADTLIPALLTRRRTQLTSIVNAYDDGKSTGDIRRIFGMLGPSDIRKVQALMLSEESEDYPAAIALFRHRFSTDADHGAVLTELRRFAEGGDVLGGIRLVRESLAAPLRLFIDRFLGAIELFETADAAPVSFADWSLMNCIYAGAFLHHQRNIEDAALFLEKLFQLRGSVLPTSVEDKKLVAIRENGDILYSEAEIVELRSSSRIRKIYLHDRYPDPMKIARLDPSEREQYFEMHNSFVRISDRVRHSLSDADVIIYAPGTQHSSLYPSYMSKQLAAAIIDNTKALKVFIPNIGADYETPMYTASDYVEGALKYLSLGYGAPVSAPDVFTHILVNRPRSPQAETYVQYSEADLRALNCPVLYGDFESTAFPGRHDSTKIVDLTFDLFDSRALTFRPKPAVPASPATHG